MFIRVLCAAAVVSVGCVVPAQAKTVDSAGSFAYIKTHEGKPVRWNPCKTITYKVNINGMPYDDTKHIKAAFASIATATGLKFAYKGTTTLVPDKASQVPSSGADIVVAFADAGSGDKRSDLLKGTEGAAASPLVRQTSPSVVFDGYLMPVYYTGAVVVNKTNITARDAKLRRTVYLHELAHIFNLNHVNDPSQVMNPSAGPGSPSEFGKGDLAGLAGVGAKHGCLVPPVLPEDDSISWTITGDRVLFTMAPAASKSGELGYMMRNFTDGTGTAVIKEPKFPMKLRDFAPFVGEEYDKLRTETAIGMSVTNKVYRKTTDTTMFTLPQLRFSTPAERPAQTMGSQFVIPKPKVMYGDSGLEAANPVHQTVTVAMHKTEEDYKIVTYYPGNTIPLEPGVTFVRVLTLLKVQHPVTGEWSELDFRGQYPVTPPS